MNKVFWTECRSVFERINTDDSVAELRVAIITGGKAKGFTAGLDLMDFAGSFGAGETDPARGAYRFLSIVASMQESFTAIEKCRVPVIAAVHGACIGGGIDLITACDIRLASSDAYFSVKEVDIGMAADVGTLQRLPKVVGNQSWVKEVCLTARNFSATEAAQVGLLSQVVATREALLETAVKLAELIASKSPVAVFGTKRVLNHARDHPVAQGLEYVGVWNASFINTQDVAIGMKASLAKEKPVFGKL